MASAMEVRHIFDYSPETGLFTWKNPQYRRLQGLVAGSITNFGYWALSVNGKYYAAHRVVFLYMNGALPDSKTEEVDHINGFRTDNRFCNLRIVTRAENQRNKRISKTNKTGIVGVCWNTREAKWEASIRINGKLKTFKRTTDFFEACALRRSAELSNGYHENHGSIGAI